MRMRLSMNGKRIVRVRPLPWLLSMESSPPCSRTMRRTINNPSPLPDGFGCEIRLKYATQIFRRHAAAGIDKSDDHVRIGQIGPNAQRAVAVHGFDTVFDHVVKRLLHLIAIELKQWQIRAQLLFNDYLAVLNLRREKANRFFDNCVYIFRPQLRT